MFHIHTHAGGGKCQFTLDGVGIVFAIHKTYIINNKFHHTHVGVKTLEIATYLMILVLSFGARIVKQRFFPAPSSTLREPVATCIQLVNATTKVRNFRNRLEGCCCK